MKLQISFDVIEFDRAMEIAKDVVEYADIIELGTLFLYKHGIQAVVEFKKAFPKTTILADTRLVERGKDAATLFANAGADWITILGGTSNNVIHASCTAAHEKGLKVLLDLVDSESLGQSALEAKRLGADAVLLHQPYDENEAFIFMDKWDMVNGNTDLPIFISAKINRDNIDEVASVHPHAIIIGHAITQAENPKEEAAYFHAICSKN